MSSSPCRLAFHMYSKVMLKFASLILHKKVIMCQLAKCIVTCFLVSITISFGPKLEPCTQVLHFYLEQIQNPSSISVWVLGGKLLIFPKISV